MRARRELRDEEASRPHARGPSGDLRRLCCLIRHAARPGSFATTVRCGTASVGWCGGCSQRAGSDGASVPPPRRASATCMHQTLRCACVGWMAC